MKGITLERLRQAIDWLSHADQLGATAPQVEELPLPPGRGAAASDAAAGVRPWATCPRRRCDRRPCHPSVLDSCAYRHFPKRRPTPGPLSSFD